MIEIETRERERARAIERPSLSRTQSCSATLSAESLAENRKELGQKRRSSHSGCQDIHVPHSGETAPPHPQLSLGACLHHFGYDSNKLGCAVSTRGVEAAAGKETERGLASSDKRKGGESSKAGRDRKPDSSGLFA